MITESQENYHINRKETLEHIGQFSYAQLIE